MNADIGNTECYDGVLEFFKDYTKQALTGPDYNYEEAVEAMKPKNHGKALSEYYSDLEEFRF